MEPSLNSIYHTEEKEMVNMSRRSCCNRSCRRECCNRCCRRECCCGNNFGGGCGGFGGGFGGGGFGGNCGFGCGNNSFIWLLLLFGGCF